MTDIQAPYITQMQRNGDCSERQAFYGIGNHPIDDNAVLVGTFERDVYGETVDTDRDYYVETSEGQIVAHRNLQRYLTEHCGITFHYELD